ncbi:MAG: hypothetical protein J4G18_10815 [Anaerolineae bacterium]|nr:hypothetical protein [Anaerolineae bacterium]
MAQDTETPTIAFVRYSGSAPIAQASDGTLDSLEAYGYLTPAERAAINESYDLYGEKVVLLYRDAGFDLPSVNLMVEDVLDKGADVILTITTQVAQIAVNATRDMEDPPAILFSLTTPFDTGIADSLCIKPDHVAGTQPVMSFEQYVPLVVLQDPDIQVIGTIVTPDQDISILGTRLIKEIGESLGLTVEVATATSLADVSFAAESLLDQGAEAIVLPVNPLTAQAMPVLVQLTTEYGVALYAPRLNAVFRGATVAAGFQGFYHEGVIAARILHAHLIGDIDIADLSIHQSFGFGIAVNLDTAAEQGIEISDDLLAMATFVVENGQRSQDVTADVDEVSMTLHEMSSEERRAADLEFLAGLECTDEMIAEQQVALDAAK